MWIHLLITEQIDGANGTAVIRDTHDGYWTKRFLEQFKRPTIETVLEYVEESPKEAIELVKWRVPASFDSLIMNVEYRIQLARQILVILLKQDDDDTEEGLLFS